MTRTLQSVRVLYSFSPKLGAARICRTAWLQVRGLFSLGAIDANHQSVASPQNLKPATITDSLKLEQYTPLDGTSR